jgi:hypothetical protein
MFRRGASYMSEYQEKELDTSRSLYRWASSHPTLQSFKANMVENNNFYFGDQWPASMKRILSERNQDPVVINMIKALINQASGIEIQSRIRIAYRTQSYNKEYEKLAEALTHYVYAFQEMENIPHFQSIKFRDALVCGIGWSNIYRQDGRLRYEYVDPGNMLFDADDLTPGLTNQEYVIRLRWIPVELAKGIWPKHAKYFDTMFNDADVYSGAGGMSGELLARQQNFFDVYSVGNGKFGRRILIVECQRNVRKPCYFGFDEQGNSFSTFNEEEAEELSAKKGDLEEKIAVQKQRTVFTSELLLETRPLTPNIPNLSDFTYIPIVWERNYADGRPVSWLESMKDPQREINYLRAVHIRDLSSSRVMVNPAKMGGMDLAMVARIVKDPTGVLPFAPEDIRIESNNKFSPAEFDMVRYTKEELQQVSGIHNEAMGKETNAVSGRAIEDRQANSVRSQVFAFDCIKQMKKREGAMMLAFVQGSGEEFIQSHVLNEGEKESIILNISRMVRGKKVMFNDIRNIPIDEIEPEEVPDFSSSQEEQSYNLKNLLSNPNGMMLMQSPELLKRLGIRDYEALAGDMQAITQQQNNAGKPSEAPGTPGAIGMPLASGAQ